MYSFEIKIPTEIYFGVNVEEKVGQLISKYANKVMLIYGSERIFESGLGDSIASNLENSGCQVVRFGGVRPNADIEYIEKAIEIARAENVNGLVAIGGGSVIDSAKAVSAGFGCTASVMDLFRGNAETTGFLPIAAIVTAPATASEANGMAVIEDYRTCEKVARYFEGVIPKFAFLNPELTLTVPTYQTAVGGFDSFSHAFERYMDLRRGSMLLDRMSASLMRTVIELLPKAIDDPWDIVVRSELMLAANMAHNNMLGPGGDFACHGIAHGITTSYGLAHGGSLAMVIPAWCEYMKDRHPERMENFFKEVFNALDIDDGIRRLKDFIQSLGLPLKMKADCDEIDSMAERIAGAKGFVGEGFEKMYMEDIAAVLRKVIIVA